MGWWVRSLLIASLTILLVIAAPLIVSSQSSPSPSPSLVGAPVRLGNQTIFTLQDQSSSSSLEFRAQRVSNRIATLARDQNIPLDALSVREVEGNTLIYAEDMLLVTITGADARAAGKSQQILSQEYLQAIQQSVEQYRKENSALYLTQAAIAAALGGLALIVALIVLSNLMPRLYRWLDQQRNRRIPSLRIQNFELMSSDQLSDLLQELTKLLRLGLILGLLYAYFSFVLNLFPQTRSIGKVLFGYMQTVLLKGWNAFLDSLPNLLMIGLIGLAAHYFLGFLKRVFDGISRHSFSIQGFYPEWAEPTYQLLKYLVIALAGVIAFPYIPGSRSPAFQGISLFLGALLSLGGASAVANIVSGFILIYTRAFQIGDRVKVGDITGDVEEKTILVTRIRTLNNVLVTVPNAVLLGSNISNYSALLRDTNTPVILATTVSLGYDVPWRTVHPVLIAAALATPDILAEPAPFVLQTALNDFYVAYEIRACTNRPDIMLIVYSNLHQNIQDKCNEAGIEICSPHYAALRDGNQSTIPATYLDQNYTAPGIRIHPLSSFFK